MTSPYESTIPYGFCQCGCGEKTPLADRSRARLGHVKGQPIPFIGCHSKRVRLPLDTGDPEQVDGYPCRRIPLTGDLYALVDDAYYAHLMEWKWQAVRSTSKKPYYAVRTDRTGDKPACVKMHRYILGLTDSKIMVDHINGNTLDNRRVNLRAANNTQNQWNRKTNKNNTTGIRGVNPHPNGGFVARISVNKKEIYLGRFDTLELAIEARGKAAELHYGDYARGTNV